MTEDSKSKITRRRFVAGTVAGLAVGAVVGAAGGYLGKASTTTTSTQTSTQTSTTTQAVTSTLQPWLPATWDYTADVVVVGSGLAGLSSAISAADAGANVILLEKLDQTHEGGNSRVSGNMFWAPSDATAGAQYITAMEKGSLTDQNIISYMAQGLMENLNKITSYGGTYTYMAQAPNAAEWPVYPGAATVNEYEMSVNGKGQLGGGHLWQTYRTQVSNLSNITVMYSTPATDLIQNGDTKEILGVTALTGGTVSSAGLPTGGTTINIKANKGVILACGTFEFDFDMQHQYLPAWPVYGFGTPGNTGDGVRMAQNAGADLWHMDVVNGGSPSCIVVPDYPYPISTLMGPSYGGWIWVDKHGNRYVNESIGFGRHGWETCEWTLQFNGTEGDFLRIPTWCIFDETTRLSGPFVSSALGQMTFFTWYSGYTWSSDNSVEISKGWITKGTSIADLASQIAADPDNANPMGQPTMDATGATLQATINTWNGFVAAGTDTAFGRPKSTMQPIQTAPFYAVKLWPGTVNFQGGPRRNINCQIIDPDGNAIPRLYAAGECGSFWGWTYNAGGNIGECQFSGRTAGANAAAETDWT